MISRKQEFGRFTVFPATRSRLVLGLAMSAHGAQKLLGWFGGYGLNQEANPSAKIGGVLWHETLLT